MIVRSLGVLSAAGVLFLGYVFAVSEWKMRRSYDAPLVPLHPAKPPDLVAGGHMAKVAGCWAGCHGNVGEGGFESINDIHRSAAPTLSQVLPQYSDEELVRQVRYGVKRGGKSSIGMIAYATWPLGDQDLADIIAFLRAQPVLPPVERSHDITLRGRWAMVTGEWGVDAVMVDTSVPRWGELPRETPFERGRYLASVVCAACHGRNLRGSMLESTPSLTIVADYSEEQFRQLLRTAIAAGGREVKRMSWVRHVEFTDQEIDDLYAFLQKHDGLQIAASSDGNRPSAVRDKGRRAAGPMTPNHVMQRSPRRLHAAADPGRYAQS
jgi:cytochrome c553